MNKIGWRTLYFSSLEVNLILYYVLPKSNWPKFWICMCMCVCFRIHIERQQAQSINISKHPLRPTSINLNINTNTYINLNIKCSIPPQIYTYMHIPMHVSGLISLWGPANSLFVCSKNITFDTTARSKQHMHVVHWQLTTYIW